MNEYYIKNKVLPYLYISAGMGGKFAARAAAIGEAMDRQTRKKEFSNMKKKLGLMIASVLTAVPAANITAGICLFNTAVARSKASLEQTQGMTGVNWGKYAEQIGEMEIVLSESRIAEYHIKSDDGLMLYGQYFRGAAWKQGNVKKIAVCFHGYTGFGGGNNSAAAKFFLENGFDVLLPDARAHGQSEGEYIGFGCLDRYDGLEWIKFLQNKYRMEDREGRLEIYLYGVSMGGATVCMMSGLDLPECVKAIISDCAFTSPEAMFELVLKNKYHLPPAPVMLVANMVCQKYAGYTFNKCSSDKSVKRAKVPMLFIHGSGDTFIPETMCHKIYENCASDKDILIIDDAVHAESYYKDRDRYENKMREFLKL